MKAQATKTRSSKFSCVPCPSYYPAGVSWPREGKPFSLYERSVARRRHCCQRVARQQVQPPIVFDRYEGLNRPPWGATPPQHLQKPLETNTTQLSQ